MSSDKILIVEDSELLHRMYDLIFSRSWDGGAEVVHAFNGQDGLDRLREHPDTDLIILDINMPVMGGLSFLERCRGEETYSDIPVIIISTEGKEEDTIRGLKAGANAYLTKPFVANDLTEIVEKVLTSSNGGNGGREASSLNRGVRE